MSRWLYHGLHSLDFPWLYNHRPLWDIVVITFMLGGTALCVTSLILAWRVLGRKLGARFPARRAVIPSSVTIWLSKETEHRGVRLPWPERSEGRRTNRPIRLKPDPTSSTLCQSG